MKPENPPPAYLVFDVETVPDGELIGRTRFPNDELSAEQAVEKYRNELLERSDGKSDFIPLSFCYPVAICVARISEEFKLQSVTCLDEPKFRPREIVSDFWRGLAHYRATLISFNGRGFDLPVLELAAFRFGLTAEGHFSERFGRRYRYGTAHLDLHDWLSNHGAVHVTGGLNLLSKLLGKPGKFNTTGNDVWQLFKQSKIQEINDYCTYDVLDTYFVFLRTRVMTGEIDLKTEQKRVGEAKEWLQQRSAKQPHLKPYLENWGDWKPWV